MVLLLRLLLLLLVLVLPRGGGGGDGGVDGGPPQGAGDEGWEGEARALQMRQTRRRRTRRREGRREGRTVEVEEGEDAVVEEGSGRGGWGGWIGMRRVLLAHQRRGRGGVEEVVEEEGGAVVVCVGVSCCVSWVWMWEETPKGGIER